MQVVTPHPRPARQFTWKVKAVVLFADNRDWTIREENSPPATSAPVGTCEVKLPTEGETLHWRFWTQGFLGNQVVIGSSFNLYDVHAYWREAVITKQSS